jgi:hypothetical protein
MVSEQHSAVSFLNDVPVDLAKEEFQDINVHYIKDLFLTVLSN